MIKKMKRKHADSLNKNNITPSRNDNNKMKRRVVDSVNIKNGKLIKRFSDCGKTYLMNYILLRKGEPILIII